jgi:hypothetical protein
MSDHPALNASADPVSTCGSLAYSAQHAALGITRAYVEIFEVGAYKYTRLPDAIAQALRNGAK